jgi:RHS repeat-associated protein
VNGRRIGTASDHLGPTGIVIDLATSELVERGTYLAMGGADSDYRPTRWNSFREDHRFTGKEEDVEVGLQYFGKRFLSPYLGRWMSPDPLNLHGPTSGDPNLYAYVQGRYLIIVDPVGLAGFWRSAWESAKRFDFGPSSPVGDYVAHADYFGHSVVQSDRNLQTAQNVTAGVTALALVVIAPSHWPNQGRHPW